MVSLRPRLPRLGFRVVTSLLMLIHGLRMIFCLSLPLVMRLVMLLNMSFGVGVGVGWNWVMRYAVVFSRSVREKGQNA